MFEINSTYKLHDTCTALKNIISRFFLFTKRFGGRFISWWGESEILFSSWLCPWYVYDHKNHYFPLRVFLQTFKRWWRMNLFRRKGDPRVHSSFLGGGGLVQSSGSRVLSPGFTTAFRICRPNCDRKMLESCLLGCQKVAKKLPKIQKVVTARKLRAKWPPGLML